MSITRHHNEWLSLVPNSGPFLSLPVLAQAFPQGLEAHDADHARRLRMAFDEWDDNQLSKRPDPGLHRAWMKFVLTETLGYDELLAEGQAIPQTLKSEVAEYGETLRPDWIVNDPTTQKVRLLIQVYPRSQSLTKPVAASGWKTSPDTRMMQLLHDTGIRLGIVTNGDHWMLVNAPRNETTGYVTWHANLWLEEPVTLRSFRTLLGADRLFSVPENETLEALLDKSANDQQEVTDQLGYQVRKAVEVLIQALDKADQEHGRKLLADVNEKVLYESALTVMMRLVFLFCAEERELLLLGDELYDKNYAVSTLREQLRVTSDQFGEENAKPDHAADSWVIIFFDWPLRKDAAPDSYSGRVAADYPVCHKSPNAQLATLATQIVEDVVERTIAHEQVKGASEEIVRGVFRLLCRYAGERVAIKRLSEELSTRSGTGVSATQVNAAIDYLENTLLIRLLKPLEIGRKRHTSPPTICLCDHFIRYALLREEIPLAPWLLKGKSETLATQAGHSVEGIVGNLFASTQGVDAFFFPERKNEPEVDVVLSIGVKQLPIEVKYRNRISLTDLSGLRSFCGKPHYEAPFGIVVTQSLEGEIAPGIIAVPAKALLVLL